jgi:hypothetical protein
MAVGHGRVAGVPRFGEKAEVREAQAAHQGRADLPPLEGLTLLGAGMDDHDQEQQPQDPEQAQPEVGLE